MSIRSELPDWTDLQFFVELARNGNLSATARALGVTHATVSRHIASLEERLKQPVFERRTGRFVLTAHGERMIRLANEMEERALAIARVAAGVDHDVTGSVRVTTTEAFGAQFLMPFLRDLGRRHPGLQIELLADQRNLSLARREADLALRMGQPAKGELLPRKLSDIAYYFYASEAYFRENKGRNLGYIGYEETTARLPEMRHFVEVADNKRIVFRTNNLVTRAAAVREGVGAALLPRYLGEALPGVGRVDPDERPLRRELWLVVHRELKDVPRVRVTHSFLTNAIAAMADKLG